MPDVSELRGVMLSSDVVVMNWLTADVATEK
jgi:hypothetical protein